MKESKTIFDSFNARYMSNQEVAESFIPNEYFHQLFDNSHALLMGPRGCGKTTLLKMLSPSSLLSWDQKHRTDYFSQIPFYAIYVPTDILWKRQLDELSKVIEDKSLISLISKSTVTISVLISTLRTFSELIRIYRGEDEFLDTEISIAKALTDLWLLSKPVSPTFESIEVALMKKVRDINVEVKRKMFEKDYKPVFESFFYSDYIDLISISFKNFESRVPEASTKRWALCFDELEIAPDWLQTELISNFRSRDQKILFKLTTAPLISINRAVFGEEGGYNASLLNDYRIIKIWTSNQKEFRGWYDFCKKVCLSRMRRKYNLKIDPEDIFGRSDFDRLLDTLFKRSHMDFQKQDFEEGTSTWNIVKSLAEMDDSFKKFLLHKKIDPLNPHPRNKNQRDEVFRKIKQIVIYRYQFRRSGSFMRSRKVVPLYYGVPLVFEFCDGNPRMLVGMLDEMLDNSFDEVSKKFRILSINEQSRKLTAISSQYLAVMSAHPDANTTIKKQNYNLRSLLESIGSYFYGRMIEKDFSMDPVGSFRIDDLINNKLLELLELAAFLGAIVCLDEPTNLTGQGIIGRRFRLSYTLSPYFSLLSREFPSINLSNILHNAPKGDQTSLF